jgi:hypothetical protein
MLMVIFSSCSKGLHLKVALEDLVISEYPALIGEPHIARYSTVFGVDDNLRVQAI